MRTETIAIHGGNAHDCLAGAVAAPIYQTAAYEFESGQHATSLFNLEVPGHRYSRISNPTNDALEKRLSLLEGGVGALAVSSGQAALTYSFLNVVTPGKNIVAAPQMYGTTHTLLAHYLRGFHIDVRFATSDAPGDIAGAIDENTRAVFCESVGNPAGNICDVEAVAEVAHAHDLPLIVDNTVATPVLLRAFDYGADIVVHSLTKFLGGHGTTLGGAIVDSGNFPWSVHPSRFPMFSEPDPSYHGLVYNDHFGRSAFIGRCRSINLRIAGATLSPFSAFLIMQGIETVALRVERHVENTRHVAGFLRAHPLVEWINYVGFPEHPNYVLAQKYLGGRAVSLLAFGLAGGLESAMRFYDALQLVKRVVNLGDAKSLACHPASTTHRQMSPEEQDRAGVRPELIRLSVGIEHVQDIIDDLSQALAASTQHSQAATLEAAQV
jgi:O-acetylhomoserine (thiol)-lyase